MVKSVKSHSRSNLTWSSRERQALQQQIQRGLQLDAEAAEHARKRKEEAYIELKVKIGAFDYGLFSAASVAHGCTVEEAVSLFINETDALCNWDNDDYLIWNDRPVS